MTGNGAGSGMRRMFIFRMNLGAGKCPSEGNREFSFDSPRVMYRIRDTAQNVAIRT